MFISDRDRAFFASSPEFLPSADGTIQTRYGHTRDVATARSLYQQSGPVSRDAARERNRRLREAVTRHWQPLAVKVRMGHLQHACIEYVDGPTEDQMLAFVRTIDALTPAERCCTQIDRKVTVRAYTTALVHHTTRGEPLIPQRVDAASTTEADREIAECILHLGGWGSRQDELVATGFTKRPDTWPRPRELHNLVKSLEPVASAALV